MTVRVYWKTYKECHACGAADREKCFNKNKSTPSNPVYVTAPHVGRDRFESFRGKKFSKRLPVGQ